MFSFPQQDTIIKKMKNSILKKSGQKIKKKCGTSCFFSFKFSVDFLLLKF